MFFSVAALACSIGIIVSGVLDKGKLSAILGGLVTVIIGAQNLFPVRARTAYYQVMVAECDNLIDEIKFRINDQESFSRALDTLSVLRKRQEPQPGEDAVKGLLAEVKATETGTS